MRFSRGRFGTNLDATPHRIGMLRHLGGIDGAPTRNGGPLAKHFSNRVTENGLGDN
jgi:hypothetical protein